MEKALESAERELARAEKHLARFLPDGKFFEKPESFKKDAEEEVEYCRNRLQKMKKTGEYVPQAHFTGLPK